MPRFARLHAPGAVVHLISRFVNRAFRLTGAVERAHVLEQLPSALERCDWTLLGFALMSSHIHLVMRAGNEPAWRFLKSWQTSVARRLNLHQRAFGPVFAERAKTIVVPAARTGMLLAYVHNNPVRAAVVLDPAATTWTSHRAYVGLDPSPAWLDVTTGLELSGFAGSPAGRTAFHGLVVASAEAPRDPVLSGAVLPTIRSTLRRVAGLSLETSSPRDGPSWPCPPSGRSLARRAGMGTSLHCCEQPVTPVTSRLTNCGRRRSGVQSPQPAASWWLPVTSTCDGD